MKDFRARCKGSKQLKGFTLIEILVVVAILGILLIISFFFFQRHMMRARDAERKSDLERIEIAFEDYYNDNGCYPTADALYTCGSTNLSPYLKEVPCDPLTQRPYVIDYLNGDPCKGYRVLAALEIQDDPNITGVGCDEVQGCIAAPNESYNYGTAKGAGVGSVLWTNFSTDDKKYYCIPYEEAGETKYECHALSVGELFEEYNCNLDYAYDFTAEGGDLCKQECITDGVEEVRCSYW